MMETVVHGRGSEYGSRWHPIRGDSEIVLSSDVQPEFSLQVPPELLDLVVELAAELLTGRQSVAEPSPYLSVDEAAEYLRAKPKRIYDLCSQRRLPFVKDGSRTLIRRSDLDVYLDASA